MQAASEAAGAGLRVCVPGIVEAWNEEEQTVSVQPAIMERVSFGGAAQEMNIPLLVDVPVVFPRAGGYTLAFVPQKGDECLVVFADMCIDSWWQSGGIRTQADSRRHDLSDGFAILGPWSQVRKPRLPKEGCRLQNDEGTAGVALKDGTVNLFGEVLINGEPYLSHTHSVSQGASATGGVT